MNFMRFLSGLFVLGLLTLVVWALDELACGQRTRRINRDYTLCRCGHFRCHHYASDTNSPAYCQTHQYDRAGGEPECSCGVFTKAWS